MSEYKRLTERYIDEQGINCVRGLTWDGEILHRLAELEDKIENGTLVELPCKVGDTATAVIDTFAYDNSVQKVKIEGLAYIVKDENGDMTFQHISRLFPNEEEAEAKLKELQEKKNEQICSSRKTI